ncbi:hypothetical protein K1719_007353 [Acacia pycnantha]|nr:hypothetical protein K1719_007353 [Acacia pycnantha]
MCFIVILSHGSLVVNRKSTEVPMIEVNLVWDLHGEASRYRSGCETSRRVVENDTYEDENLIRMVCDAYGVPRRDDMDSGLNDSEEPNAHAKRNDETSDDVNCEFSIFKKSGEPRGHYESINLSHEEYCQATMEHMSELEAQGSQSQCKGFPDWFRSRVGVLSKQGHVSPDLRSLSIGPLKVVNRYSMFIGNGFRFHTKDRAIGKKTQNNGVMVKGDDINADKEYYGVLDHIYELSYIGNRKIYLFKCHWWDVAHYDKGYKVDKYGFTSINTQCSLQTNEPFILASQAEQIFYVDDLVRPSWLVVVKTNPRDLFNMPIDKDNDVSGVNVVMVDEVAYQQLVVDLNIDNPTHAEHDFIINLYGEDLQHQTFVQAGEPSQRNNRDVMDIGFIDDNETHSSGHEDSNEEDVLDDYESDTEIESDTENEVQENEAEDTDISDSASEASIE